MHLVALLIILGNIVNVITFISKVFNTIQDIIMVYLAAMGSLDGIHIFMLVTADSIFCDKYVAIESKYGIRA